ncbi:MAG: hypothetical protein KGQ67_02855 [Betaproteobacteria bacterium]|nr:hypothetical protein [Betaproteobacteria bacterium]
MSARRLPAAALACLLAVAATVVWRLLEGPSWSWDRGHYHAYAGYAWAEGRVGQGFLPMGGQSFLNPLPYVPAWLLARAGSGELGVALLQAGWHGLAVWFVWLIARDRLGPGPAAWLVGALALLTPVFLALAGTSYADGTTAVPLVAGVWCCTRASAGSPAAGRWAFAGGFALGLAALLKLSNAPAAALAPVLFLGAGLAGRRLRRLAVIGLFLAGGVAGAIAGGGAWAQHLYRVYGNPVFPMAQFLFDRAPLPAAAPAASPASARTAPPAPAAAPAAPVAAPRAEEDWLAVWRHRLFLLKVATRPGGERFVPGSLAQWAEFPFRVADPRQPGNLAYLEWHAPDPRLALLVVLLAALAVQRLRARRPRPAESGGASAARGEAADRGPRQTAPARRPDPAAVAAWPLWLFTVLWCLAWMHSSGNGRYAVGLLLLCAVLLVEGVRALLPAGRARQAVLAGLLGVHAFYALVAADRRDLGQGEAWAKADLAADMPSSLRDQPHLHVALSQFSWTYLAPLMHPDSAFANLSSPCEYCSAPLQARSAMPVLGAWRGRLRLIAAADRMVDGQAGLLPVTRDAMNDQLADFDLRIDEPACTAYRVRPQAAGAWLVEEQAAGQVRRFSDQVVSCPLVDAPGARAGAVERRSRFDPVFSAIERACGETLGPSTGPTRWLGGEAWLRTYPRVEAHLTVARGLVTLGRYGHQDRVLGRADDLAAPEAAIDCRPMQDRSGRGQPPDMADVLGRPGAR